MATTQPLDSVMAHALPITIPPRTYTKTARANQILPAPNDEIQQPEIRNHHSADQTRPSGSDKETSSDSDHTLTPDSTASGSGQSQALPELTEAAKDHDVHGTSKIKYENVHDFPEGFPQLAALMNSNDSFALYRRFGRLSDRLLLHLQLKLTMLEKELDEIDKDDGKHPELRKRNYGYEGFEEDISNPRKTALLSEVLETLEKYVGLLSRVTELRTRGHPPSHQYQSLFRWVWYNRPLGEGFYDFIFHAEDFVSTADKNNSFEDFIESNLAGLPIIKSLLLSKAPHKKAKDEYSALHYSDAYFTAFSKLLAVCIAVALLLIPTFLLYLVPMTDQEMVWVVFGFVFAFSTTFAVATQGKVQDVFVATAAYAAVLVTFLGNVGQSVKAPGA